MTDINVNPYQPPLSIDALHLVHRENERLKRLCCPVCGCDSVTRPHKNSHCKGQCPECKTKLRKSLPLWVNLSTVLSYSSGFLLFTSIRRVSRFEKAADFWELYFYAAMLLIIVPHLISGHLYRKHYRLVVAATSRSHQAAATEC